MKKIILILNILIIFTGCTTDYNLNIDNNNIRENIEINIPANLSNNKKDKIDDYFKDKVSVFTNMEEENTDFYNIDKSFEKNSYKYKLNYKYDLDSFYNTSILNNCFDDFQYKNTDKFIAIKVSGKFYCKYDNKQVNIKIKTNNYISNENAISKDNGVYTWIIDDSNKDKTNIEFMMYKNLPQKYEESSLIPLRIKNLIIALFLIIFIFSSGILINIVLKKIDSI